MNWNKNAIPFIPSLALNDDWTDYDLSDLVKLSIGNSMQLQITLTDNSMYDRYYKDDIVNINLYDSDKPILKADALLLLPDNSVIFRSYTIENNQITIQPIFIDFEPSCTFPAVDIQILGIAANIIRMA